MQTQPRVAQVLLRPLIVAALVTSVLVFGVTAPGHVQETRGTDPAAAAFRGCLAAGTPGDLLFLFDQSRSLQTSDPADGRVAAGRLLAETLAQFAESNDADLSLAVSGFDVNFESRSQWESVQGGSATETITAIESMADQTDGWETDYWNALEGARAALYDRAQEAGGGPRCQAVVWFSDGKFELDARDTQEEVDLYGLTKTYAPGLELRSDADARNAEAAGRESLCRGGGLADQVRATGIHTIAVGLQAGEATADDFTFMESIATGAASGATCGEVQAPDSGSFTLASNVDDLLFAFQSGDPPPHPICQTTGCPEGLQAVVVDRSIRSVGILASSQGVPGATLELRSPTSNAPVEILNGQNGQRDLAGVAASWQWATATAVKLTLTPSDPAVAGWSGVWSVAFFDPAAPPGSQARTDIQVEGDLTPALLNATDIEWRVGGTIDDLQFGITRRGTDEVVPAGDIVSTLALEATLQPMDGQAIPIISGADPAALQAPASADLSRATVTTTTLVMTLDVTTAPAAGPDGKQYPGTILEPAQVRLPVTMLPPANFPGVPTQIDFGTTEGTELSSELIVTGPGCVWLEGAVATTAPDGVGDISVTGGSSSQADCVQVDDGDQTSLPLSLSIVNPGNGAVTGNLQVGTSPLEDLELVEIVQVQFLGDLRKPVNEAVRASTATGLVVAGIVIPVLILLLVARRNARIPSAAIEVASTEVDFRDGALSQRGVIGGVHLRQQDFHVVTVQRNGTRMLELPSTPTVTLRVSANPLDPHVGVRSEGYSVTTSRGGSSLPLAVQNSWILLHNQSAGAHLVVLMTGGAGADQVERLVADAQHKAAEILPAPAVKVPDDGWPGSGGWSDPNPEAPGHGWGQPEPGPPSGRSGDSWDDWQGR